MASGRRVRQRPDCHTFPCKFWHFQMAVSQWKLAWLTPNLGILWISVSSFWLCESIVANAIIYRLVPRPSRFETRQCHVWPRSMISKGNNVNFARFVLLAVSEEAETWLPRFFVQCIIKKLLDSVFVIFRIIKVLVSVISLSLCLRLITLTSTLIILNITKTSSNNCL